MEKQSGGVLGTNAKRNAIAPLLAALALIPGAHAATSTWQHNAQGQLVASDGMGNDYYWPNNTLWSQQQVIGNNPINNAPGFILQPSNWSTVNYPDNGNGASNYDVIVGSQGSVILDRVVTVDSFTLAPGGGLSIAIGGRITSPLYDIQIDTTIAEAPVGGGSTPALTVPAGGLLNKSGGAGALTITTNLELFGGSLNAQSGNILIDPVERMATSGGSFSASTGNAIEIAGVVRIENGANESLLTGSGAGELRLVDGGSLNGVAGTGAAVLDFAPGFFKWSGGSIATANFRNEGEINVTGNVLLDTALINNDTINQSGNIAITAGASGTIQSGAVWNVKNDSGMTDAGGGGAGPRIINSGLFLKSGGTGTTNVGVRYIANGGAVSAQSGRISFTGGIIGTGGTFIAAAGSVIEIASQFRPDGDIEAPAFSGSGAGQLQLVTGGSFVGNAGTQVVALNFAPGFFQWSGGSISGGKFRNDAEINIAGNVLLDTTLANPGTIRQFGGDVSVTAGATAQNEGTWEIQGDHDVLDAGGGGAGPLIANTGTFQKSSGSGTSTVATRVQNDGLISAKTGTLHFTGPFTNTGSLEVASGATLAIDTTINLPQGKSLSGSGTITSPIITQSGTISPGSSPGKLTLTGNLVATNDATTLMEIAGTTAELLYDVLAIGDDYTADGTLVLRFTDDFAPSTGDIFDIILTEGTFTGTFDQITIENLLPGWTYTSGFEPNGTFRITSTSNATFAIPEPGTIALLATAAAALLLRKRRRA